MSTVIGNIGVCVYATDDGSGGGFRPKAVESISGRVATSALVISGTAAARVQDVGSFSPAEKVVELLGCAADFCLKPV